MLQPMPPIPPVYPIRANVSGAGVAFADATQTRLAPPTLLQASADADRPEPRDLALNSDFGHPTYGTPQARDFLRRMKAENKASEARLPWLPKLRRAAADLKPDYWSTPKATLVDTYALLLGTGTLHAERYRQAVVDSFQSHSAEEGRQMHNWLDNVATFLRRSTELLARIVQRCGENTRPYAKAEVARLTQRGLAMLRSDGAVPAVLPMTETVVAAAEAERIRRLAELEDFYQQAMMGRGIMGLPPARDLHTFRICDSRLIFYELKDALLMAPRASFVKKMQSWPVIVSLDTVQYAPHNFHGEIVKRIDFINPDFVRSDFNNNDDVYERILQIPGEDGNSERDQYRFGRGEWTTCPQPTTPELEIQKATWFARIYAAAVRATARP